MTSENHQNHQRRETHAAHEYETFWSTIPEHLNTPAKWIAATIAWCANKPSFISHYEIGRDASLVLRLMPLYRPISAFNPCDLCVTPEACQRECCLEDQLSELVYDVD